MAAVPAELEDAGTAVAVSLETNVPEEATVAPRAVVFTITTRPTGARVRFNGDDLGDADSVSISVSPGQRHQIGLELAGYLPFSWAFSLEDLGAEHLDSGSLHFPLTPIAWQPDGAGAAAGGEQTDDEKTAIVGDPNEGERVSETNGGESISTPANSIPPTPGPVRRVKAPSQTAAPHKITHIEPEVSGTARGVVVLEIEISARGNVVQAKLLRGLSPAVNQAALDAVVQWKYEPSIVDGSPVNVVMTVTLPVNGG